jgi:type I restriction enzyme S subunit
MKLETFFEKFEMFADAPNAVAKMRELVLRLAVQGKLVPQDPNDEPADSIIRATQSLFQRLVAAKKLSSPKPLPPIEDDDVLFSLPSGWAWCRLGQVMRISSGDGLIAKDMNDGPFPVYGGNGVNGYHDEHNVAKRTLVIGRVGFYCGSIHLTPEKAWVTDNAFITTFDEANVDMDFLSSLLKATDLRERDNATAQPVISGGKVYPTILALPPLAEQKRIVAKVDELMALCDRLEAQQQEREEKHKALSRASLARFANAPTPANLQFIFHPSYTIAPADLRKSILTLAVQGKLVPQDPNDEPAEILFERIQTERAEQEAKGTYKSSRPLEPIEDTEEPFELPVEWKWARLRSLVFTLGDGLHGTPEYSDGTDCYFINGNNLVDGRIVIKSHTKTVSLDEAKKHRKPMTLSTVLVSINGTLGSVAFYNNENVILGKSACYFNLASLVDKHFSRRVIESPYFVDYATANATGTTIRNLGLKAMNYFPFPLPPHAEQRRIVAKVDELMKLVDELETQLAASRATAANLLAALVAELTGTPNTAKVSVPTNTTTGTGRRGRPPKS